MIQSSISLLLATKYRVPEYSNADVRTNTHARVRVRAHTNTYVRAAHVHTHGRTNPFTHTSVLLVLDLRVTRLERILSVFEGRKGGSWSEEEHGKGGGKRCRLGKAEGGG